MQEITQYWHPCAVLLVDVKAQHMLDEEDHLKVCAVPVFLHAFFFFFLHVWVIFLELTTLKIAEIFYLP